MLNMNYSEVKRIINYNINLYVCIKTHFIDIL